jgi:hypothetical protein
MVSVEALYITARMFGIPNADSAFFFTTLDVSEDMNHLNAESFKYIYFMSSSIFKTLIT